MSNHFPFQWPVNAAQCDLVNLVWSNGTAPFRAFVVPIWDQPFIYNIPSSSYNNGQGSYTIRLQIGAGTNYVVFMGDANGLGTGGSSEVHAVANSNKTACLNTAAQNYSSLDFTFSITGRAKQCSEGFDLQWSGGVEDGPYNATIIPLDQGFFPFDVPFPGKANFETNWLLNMTGGSRFSVMMSNKHGYGRGGTGGIYQVDTSTRTDCIIQPSQTTGNWPAGLATNTLASATLSALPSSSSKGLSGGAIAGIVVGVLAGLAILGAAIWFLLRRRRRRQTREKPEKNDDVDLAGSSTNLGNHELDETGVHVGEEDEGEESGRVEPYRDTTYTQAGGSSPHQTRSSMDPQTPVRTSGAFAHNGEQAGYDYTSEMEQSIPGSGQAGPLPVKSPRSGFSSHIPQNSPAPGSRLRVVNRSDGDDESTPSLPPGATHGHFGHVGSAWDESRIRRDRSPPGTAATTPRQSGHSSHMAFRRHEDAGRVQQEVVDLPPLYTDVPRDR